MLDVETYLKQYFQKEIDISSNTNPKIYAVVSCWLREKIYKNEDEKKLVVKYHSFLTRKFRRLALG